jgi:hypothetical protein
LLHNMPREEEKMKTDQDAKHTKMKENIQYRET